MNKFLNRLSTLLLMLMAVIPLVHLIMYSFSLTADQRLPVFLIVAVLFCWLMFSFWRFSLPGILVCLALAILFYQGRSEILSAQFEDIANRMAVAYYNRFVASGYVYNGAELSHTEAMLFIGFILSALMGLTLNSREDRVFLPLLISLPIVFLCLLVYGKMPGWVMLCLCAFVFLLLSTGRVNAPDGNAGKSFLFLLLPVALLLSLVLLFKNPDNYNYEEQKLSLVELAQGLTQELTASLREDSESSLVNARLPESDGTGEPSEQQSEQLNVSGDTLDLADTPEQSSLDQTILYVTSTQSGHFYLRSRSYGSYTGSGWSQAPDYPGERIPAFSAQAIAASENSVGGKMEIRLESADPSVMYIPYYSTLDYDTEAGIGGGSSRYSVDFFTYNSGYSSLSLPSELRDMELSYRQFVYANYLSLPDSTRASLQELASQNSLSGDGVYETIALVAEYVRSRCPYNINTQPYPSEDYALYFFTQATEGYCIHFATAATAMYRALGLPARMVAGYAFEAEAGAAAQVLGENAHAWTEVYIDGLGWLPVEVTPGSYEGPALGGLDEEELEQPASPSPSGQNDGAAQEASPQPTEGAENSAPSEARERRSPGPWMLAAVLPVLLILFGFLRYRIKRRLWRQNLGSGKNKAALTAWRCAKRICGYGAAMPEEIQAAAQKAFFGRGLDSREELEACLSRLEVLRDETYASLSWYKKLKFRFFDGLI